MPEFDTYGTLKRYAENNADPVCLQAYLLLKRRTERIIKWKAETAFTLDPGYAARLYIGCKVKQGASNELANMTEEQRLAMYEQACAEQGIELDPSLYKKD